MQHTINIPKKVCTSALKGLIFLFTIFVTSGYTIGQDFDDDNDGIPNSMESGLGDFSLDNVFNIGGLDNSAVELNPNEIQLTQDGRSLRGGAMSRGKIDFAFDFTFSVEAYFGVNNGPGDFDSGADGIAMVFHNDSAGSDAIGNDGEGIGAQGIQNGIVLEIDTYGNGNTGADDPMFGTTDDHTDIWDSDDNARASLIGGYILYDNAGDRELEDGEYHDIVFTWTVATGTLSFTVDGLNAGSISTGNAVSFISTYFAGSSTVHYGFTASTGAARNEHRIRINNTISLPLVIDTDGDGIFDHLDLDSDNDGIYDAEEAGHGAPHMDGVVSGPVGADGIPDAVQSDPNSGNINYTVQDADGDGVNNHQDLDADNDGCNDVIEVVFLDDDKDGILGTGVPSVNSLGVVIGVSSGYTTPTNEYLNSSINVCVPSVDLGDEGDGFDEVVIYIEGSPPIDFVDIVSIQDRDDLVFVNMQIAVSGVLDNQEEILTIGGVAFNLSQSVSNPVSLELNGESINVTFINNVFLFTSVVGDSALDLVTCELLLASFQYQHEDQLIPTGGDRVLSVTVNDGSSTSAPNTITIQVVPVNDEPVAVDDELTLIAFTSSDVTSSANDFDQDGTIDVASIEIVSIPIYGTAVVNANGSITYTNDSAESDSDSLTYTIRDDLGAISNTATVRITLSPNETNDGPVARPDSIQVNQGDSLDINSVLGVLNNDTDPDADSLYIVSFTIDGVTYSPGAEVVLPQGRIVIYEDGSYVFVPNADFVGSLEVTYLISDGQATASSVLSISVIEVIPIVAIQTSMIITGNGDGLNDHFKIENITSFPNNRVIIFNRWGNMVWEVRGYNNDDQTRRFSGIANTSSLSSSELPDGTYFYVIDKGDGSSPSKGFVTIKH